MYVEEEEGNRVDRLQLQAGGLALNTTNDSRSGVLGDDLVVMEHGEF